MKRAVMSLMLVAGSVAAAQAPRTIAPGMSRAEVVARLGAPLTTRTIDGSTYLFYPNGCERRCGMHDVVVLDSDRVVDAIFRSPARHYAGASSSPQALSGSVVRQAGAPRDLAVPSPAPAASPDSAAHAAPPASATSPVHPAPAPKPVEPALRRQTSATTPARSEIRIPMMGTLPHSRRGAPADTLRLPIPPARRQGD